MWCAPCILLYLCCPADSAAATIRVPSGGNLQAALDAAQSGDTILLPPGSVFKGNYVLRVKAGTEYIVVRTDVAETGAYASGVRLTSAAAATLAKIQSPSSVSALKTAAGAHHWRLELLQFGPNDRGYGDIIEIGDGSAAQNTLDKVPAHIVLDRVYVAGDPLLGQKRGVTMNAADVTVTNSTIRDIKAVGQDAQALGSFNGPGPFLVENNYLEASGENFLFGGADPPIANLIPSDLTFRRNYLSKPVSWRDPIVATPVHVTASSAAGGALAAGSYSYTVVARRPAGQTTIAQSLPSSAATITLSTAGSVTVSWNAVADATEYRVYRSQAGTSQYWKIQQTSFTDTGAGGTAGAVPTSATRWSVKNVFELKNARNIVVRQNIFENNWEAGQAGYAIVFTVRNSNGGCTWCTIQHVEFAYNIVRHSAGGVNVLGIDDPSRPSVQADDLRVHDNLFYDISKAAWGGSGLFLQIGEQPRNLVVDHNTIDSDGSSIVAVYGGTVQDPHEVYGFKYTNNLSRHNSYGVFGAGMSYGLGSITAYFPDVVFERNLLSGGSPSRYPPNNFFSPSFDSQFVDRANADYHLIASSPFKGAGTDGKDLGVDLSQLMTIEQQSSPEALTTSPRPNAPQSLRIVRN
jgi:hypothetical protein